MTVARRVFLIGGFAALFAVAIIARGRPPIVESAPVAEPALVAATFSSAFCASCRILRPKLARVMLDYRARPVDFVEFDFTAGAPDRLRDKARARGVLAVYDAGGRATGYTALVDRATGKVLGMLGAGLSEDEMRAEIDAALRKATHTDEARENSFSL